MAAVGSVCHGGDRAPAGGNALTYQRFAVPPRNVRPIWDTTRVNSSRRVPWLGYATTDRKSEATLDDLPSPAPSSPRPAR